MKLYNQLTESFKDNKQTSAKDVIIEKAVGNILATINAINEMTEYQTLVPGTKVKLSEYSIVSSFSQFIQPFRVGIIAGINYNDFYDHSFLKIDDLPVGDDGKSKHEVLEPEGLIAAFRVLYATQKQAHNLEADLEAVSREYLAINQDDIGKYGWKEEDGNYVTNEKVKSLPVMLTIAVTDPEFGGVPLKDNTVIGLVDNICINIINSINTKRQ